MEQNQNVTMPEEDMASEVEVVEHFLNEHYELRHNKLSDQLELRERVAEGEPLPFRPMTQPVTNSLIIKVRKHLPEILNPKPLVLELINSEQVPEFDPICDYLEKLPAWDGRDRVDELFRRIPGIDDQHLGWLHTWYLSAVVHWLEMDELHGNECVPTFIGQQGCGKTTFSQLLLPKHLHCYFLDHINLSNKFDKETALTCNLLANIDELDQIKRSQQAALKQVLSKSQVNGRPIYGRTQRCRKRYASFVATTNSRCPLQDPTGSRRFICIEIPQGQHIDVETPIDYEQLFAQLMYELKVEKRRFWFTDAEVAALQEANAPYQHEVSLDEVVSTCFRKPKVDEGVMPISLNDLSAHVSKSYPELKETRSFRISLGHKLKTLGYQQKRDRLNTYYYAVCV